MIPKGPNVIHFDTNSLADCMIAAVAIRCGAKLATGNIVDFKPFQPHGLVLA